MKSFGWKFGILNEVLKAVNRKINEREATELVKVLCHTVQAAKSPTLRDCHFLQCSPTNVHSKFFMSPLGPVWQRFVAKFRRWQNKSKWCVIPVWGFWLKSRGCSPNFNKGAPANIAFYGFCLFSSSGSLVEINTNSNEGNPHVISSSNDRIWDPKYMTSSYQRNSIQMGEPWHP